MTSIGMKGRCSSIMHRVCCCNFWLALTRKMAIILIVITGVVVGIGSGCMVANLIPTTTMPPLWRYSCGAGVCALITISGCYVWVVMLDRYRKVWLSANSDIEIGDDFI